MGRQQLVVDTGSEHLFLQPTTLDQVGKSEAYFEAVIADAYRKNIDLLGLGSQRRAIRGPFHVVTQLPMQTPFGHNIFPDIGLLAASGHVVVIEVKRYVNQELRNREVIAQIVDYASSFTILEDKQLLPLFRGAAAANSWHELVEEAFPQVDDPYQLAADFADCMAAGRINLVIACDKIPSVLLDAVAGISSLNATAFELEVIEVTPYSRPGSDELLFLPATRLSTQIVNRSAVTITYRHGDPKPEAEVSVMTAEDIEAEIIKSRRAGNPNAKEWTLEEVEKECQSRPDGLALSLFRFANSESACSAIEPGLKINPVFNFRIQSPNSKLSPIIFALNPWDPKPPYFYLKNVRKLSSESVLIDELIAKLKTLGAQINADSGELYLNGLDNVEKIGQFIDVMRWLKNRVAIDSN